ncbi:MAG: alpha/beta hydrolase [Myxococcota bacterium]
MPHSLEVFRAGPPDSRRPPVLFIHGSSCGGWVWAEHFMPFFAERDFLCVAPSFRGHGNSPGRDRLNDFSVDDYVEDVRLVARELGARPLVVAHSLGAQVAERLAAHQEFEAVALLAPVSPFGLVTSTLQLAVQEPGLLARLAFAPILGPQTIDPDAAARALFSDALEPALKRRYLTSFQLESTRVAFELSAQSWFPRVPRRLGGLVIGGERDVLIPRFELERTAAAYGAKLEVIAGANHVLMLDTCWRDVATRVASFFEAHLAARAA